MCGIAGIISKDPQDLRLIEKMTQGLKHRGPDNVGYFNDANVALGHRRLSVIDLSESANQPMKNENGRIHLVCNGEIYNYKETTGELKSKGHVFRSNSDCEVLLHLYEEYQDKFLDHVNGMFAFALWDSIRKRMILSVDRFGKKPLYYAFNNGLLIFASEMKTLLYCKWIKRDIDIMAVDRYLTLRYIPAPMTIFSSIKKLEPSTLLVWEQEKIQITRYWQPKVNPISGDGNKLTDLFGDILTDSIRLRLQSDVPLGIYLSGGIDSAAIAAIMRSLVKCPVKSYTATFDYKFNEFWRAKRVADYLGFDFYPVNVREEDFNSLSDIMYHLDEPFGDLLCLPAFLLAKEAKENLTVVLTGDGADEILNGYFHQRLMIMREHYNKFCRMSQFIRFISYIFNKIPSALLNHFFDYPDRLGNRERQKLSKAIYSSGMFGRFYEAVTSCFSAFDKPRLYTTDLLKKVNGFVSVADEYQEEIEKYKGFTFNSQLSIFDLKYQIPFSVIYRLDKMNMTHAVETRSPFLDYRLVEFVLNLPDEAKLKNRMNKVILRALIKRLYPPALREKGKQAFYMPMTSEFSQRYQLWVRDLLNKDCVKNRGLFNYEYINSLFEMAGKESMLARRQLISLSMLELWFRVFADPINFN